MRKCVSAAVGCALMCAGFLAVAQETSERSERSERSNRHALIIGVGEYSAANIEPLPGVKHDMLSARKIAQQLGVPLKNTTVLRDTYATNQGIRAAIAQLSKQILPGDRVFVYFSGHGTRWHDPQLNKDDCVEALLPSDGIAITNREMASLLEPIARDADKLIVLLDACHAGGVVQSTFRPRSSGSSDDLLKPRFSSVNLSEACKKPSNLRTRSLSSELLNKGMFEQNIIHISTAKPEEISLDEADKGGIGTQAFRDCLLGEAIDLDRSGSISIKEVTSCAQEKVNARLKGSSRYDPHNFTLAGNAGLLPAVFRQETSRPIAPVSGANLVSNAVLKPVDPDLAIADILAQSDPRRAVTIATEKQKLQIGKDKLSLTVTSQYKGFLYLLLLGSDKKSFYLLYPNELDTDNQVQAGVPTRLPKASWAITAAGPPGTNKIVAMVSESPRDLTVLSKTKAGPFMASLSDSQGVSNLQWIVGTSLNQNTAPCSDTALKRNLVVSRQCSDSFGSATISVDEVQ